jgi:hypothetical protein
MVRESRWSCLGRHVSKVRRVAAINGMWMRMGEAKNLMGLLPKSAVMVSQRPLLWRSKRERENCRALLCRPCSRADIEE